ncbi:cobalamin biosynthesis protein CbiG [Methyloligella halotolerans]|uniref:Cobalamin biosynthesis protein CbiG n=1 Tax=Methyloligella halotolerans TaxID=1177755 RepID=A0A1E2S1N8_9HYPH|nr:cobalamin biosynthesis protein [Methyloligella halotolerans]ODA68258.1 cobalamin biosynthesis protein CbiG [Methyloligella halotolerans]
MMVAGFGYRKDVALDALEEALALALSHCDIERRQIDAIAAASGKQDEAAVRAIAAELSVPLIPVNQDAMIQASGRTLSHSDRVMAEKAVPSVAETVALAAAGPASKLLGPKVSSRSASCAIAIGGGS